MRPSGSAAPLAAAVRTPARPLTGRGVSVSVVVPCFNYASYLRQAVGSALAQERVVVDVVIVDDASTDGSDRVARELAERDPRVRVVEHLTNQGPVETFNDGLALVTGDYVVRLDADDLLTPGSLSRSVAAAEAHPSVGLVYGRPVHFEGDPPRTHRASVTHWLLTPGRQWLEARCRRGVNVITSPEVLMRRSVLDRVGGQQELAHTHDMEMWMRLAAFSDVAYVQGCDQAWHREHPASLSATAESMLGITILEERRAAFEVLFSGIAGEIPGADELAATARQTLAREAVRRACYEFDRGRATSEGTRLMTEFALATYPGVTEQPEWAGLRAREALGAGWLPRHPWLGLRPFDRRAHDFLAYRRWRRTGDFAPVSFAGRPRPSEIAGAAR